MASLTRNKIARVFPSKTKATPNDEYAFVGDPPLEMMIPEDISEVHISVTFTWDLREAERLALAWERIAPVKIGGPALGARGEDFVPGQYLKPGYVITSRGCHNKCWFCAVPKREGDIRELPITEGNNILDDNLLACSDEHIRNVFKMLKKQKGEKLFTGGLDAELLRDWHVDLLKDLRPARIFFGCDTDKKYYALREAVKLFHNAGYSPVRLLYAYVLIGYPNDIIDKAQERLQRVWDLGVWPMAMLYRDFENQKKPDKEWQKFQREWVRPAIIYTKPRRT